MRRPLAALMLTGFSALALTACDLGPGDDPAMTTPAETPAPQPAPTPEAPTRSAEAIGEPVEAGPVSGASTLQEAAAVMQVHAIPEQNAKVFDVAGGDPAVNGLMTYLGLYIDASEGWRIYEIGNFESWRVTEEAPQRVVLDVRQSRADPASGEIVTEDSRLIVGFASDGEGPPERITLTPAR